MDHLMHEYLAVQHMQDLLDEAQAERARHTFELDVQTEFAAWQKLVTCVGHRMRRRLGVLLIQVGRRLAGGRSSSTYQRTSTAVVGRRFAS